MCSEAFRREATGTDLFVRTLCAGVRDHALQLCVLWGRRVHDDDTAHQQGHLTHVSWTSALAASTLSFLHPSFLCDSLLSFSFFP